MSRSRITSAALALCLFMAAAPAHASFHLWDIQELYTNADGSVQFVELFTSANGQTAMTGRTVDSTLAMSTNQFVFPGVLSGSTANRHLLLATAGFQAACGIAPDFVIANGFLFSPMGSVDFAGVSVVNYTALPTDGDLSLAGDGSTTGPDSPTNFSGQVGDCGAPSMTGLALDGFDTVKLSVGGAAKAKVTSESVGRLDTDAGDLSYDDDAGFEFTGQLDTSGKKPVLILDAGQVTALEGEIEEAVEAAIPGLVVNSLTSGTLKTKFSSKENNGDTSAKLGLNATFSATTNQGDISGKFALSAPMSSTPLCTICGKTFRGLEKFKDSLKGCGSLSGSGSGTLEVDADIDDGNEDGTAPWTYTDSDNVMATGTLTQVEKKISCALDATGETSLEAAFAALALAECGVTVTVDIVGQKCALKPGTGGLSASFSLSVNLTATDGMDTTTGKSGFKNKLSELSP